MSVTINPDDIATAILTIYDVPDLRGWVPVFEVFDKGDMRRVTWFDASKGLDPVIDHATRKAEEFARMSSDAADLRHVAIVGCTFGDLLNANGNRAATEANILQLHAFCVDHDADPKKSVLKLHERLTPTFSVESGGFVGEIPKRHDWYVYKQALGQPDIAEHKSAVSRLIRWCGAGDASVASPVHTIRCPGGVHRKAAPRAARIVQTLGTTHTLSGVKLAADVVAPSGKEIGQRKTAREKEDSRAVWKEAIRNGEELHDNCNKLIMSLAHDGRSHDDIQCEVESVLEESIRKDTDYNTWQQRFADIPRAINEALSKVETSDAFAAQEERRARVALMRDAAAVEKLRIDIDERIAKLTPSDASNADHLAKIFTDIGFLRANELHQRTLATKIAAMLKRTKAESVFYKEIKKASGRAWGIWNDARAVTVPDDDPRVKLDRSMGFEERVKATWAAVTSAPEPFMWRGIEGLVRLREGAKGQSFIETMDAHALGNALKRVVRWHVEGDGPNTAAHPDVVTDMLADAKPPLEVLTGFTDVPRFDADGKLLEPGYNKSVGVIYQPPKGFTLPEVPKKPTAEQVQEARELLLEVLEGFPFRDDDDHDKHPNDNDALEPWKRRALYGKASRANAVSLLLLPFGRAMITGPTPLHLVTKTQNRAGGGYLGATFTRIAYGREPQWQQEVKNDSDEWRKKISANVACGLQCFMLDNIDKAVDSGVLASALTADEWLDRVLGSSTNLTGEIRWIWYANGKNPDLSLELSRRALRIHLAPRVEEPDKRADFLHENLSKWTYENRSRLVWACLIAWQHWLAGGAKRDPNARWGGFDDYVQVMSSVLDGVGIKGFAANRTQNTETVSRERMQQLGLWTAAYGKLGQAWVPVGDPDVPFPMLLTGEADLKGGVLRLIKEAELEIDGVDLANKFAEKKGLQTKLGILLRKWEGEVVRVGETDVMLESGYDKKACSRRYRWRPV